MNNKSPPSEGGRSLDKIYPSIITSESFEFFAELLLDQYYIVSCRRTQASYLLAEENPRKPRSHQQMMRKLGWHSEFEIWDLFDACVEIESMIGITDHPLISNNIAYEIFFGTGSSFLHEAIQQGDIQLVGFSKGCELLIMWSNWVCLGKYVPENVPDTWGRGFYDFCPPEYCVIEEGIEPDAICYSIPPISIHDHQYYKEEYYNVFGNQQPQYLPHLI